MKYTMTFLERDFETLLQHGARSQHEEGAYLIGRLSVSSNEIRILIREVIPVHVDDVESRSPVHMSIRSASYVRSIKRSLSTDGVFVFVHTHPGGPDSFSPQDDAEEPPLFRVAHGRNPQPLHASLILSRNERLVGRVWLPDGTTAPLERIRVIGNSWRVFFGGQCAEDPIPAHFDRQVRAFGADIQRLLSRLHVGIVGAGGTGSAVAEQLIRLGVGYLTVIDDDRFAASNVNRVYGSSLFDDGIAKTTLVARAASHIALGTHVTAIPRHLSFKTVAEALKDTDFIFGCTDDQWGRSILIRLAIYYLLPVFDLGVIIDPREHTIRSVHGRLTILQPGNACLFCRERISADRVAAESIAAIDPARAAALTKEGYIPGADEPAPAVIAFTSAVAASAVAELLDRFIGYKLTEGKSSEFIYRFDSDAIARNSRPPKADCFCSDQTLWGAADRKPFLGVTWRPEP